MRVLGTVFNEMIPDWIRRGKRLVEIGSKPRLGFEILKRLPLNYTTHYTSLPFFGLKLIKKLIK